MIVVANTTPLIGLASIQRFDLLNHLFGEVHIAGIGKTSREWFQLKPDGS